MNPRIVIVAYKPKEGKEKALVMTHHARLKAENLVTDRVPVMMQAADGTVIEVFEWLSDAAIQAAHTNKAVGQMWQEFGEVCDYVPIGYVPESTNLFADYTPLI